MTRTVIYRSGESPYAKGTSAVDHSSVRGEVHVADEGLAASNLLVGAVNIMIIWNGSIVYKRGDIWMSMLELDEEDACERTFFWLNESGHTPLWP